MADMNGSDATRNEESFTDTQDPDWEGDASPSAGDEVPLPAERQEEQASQGEGAPGQRYRRPLGRRIVPIAIVAGTAMMLLSGGFMVIRAEAGNTSITLASQPKAVSVMDASESMFRGSRTYVGTIEPWLEARIGPQLVSAYADTVLVRPGAAVKQGEVLATLDCRNAHAASQAVAMQAKALEAQEQAVAHEATRVQQLLQGGFVSPNEAEQKTAQSAAQMAQVLATKARLAGTSLEVRDCVLRAPFDGEVATRMIDPGAFVHPGTALLSVVDRSVVRVVADAPEIDFEVVAPSTKVVIKIPSTKQELVGRITRRAPAADPGSRTVHFEIDVADPQRAIPVGTTAEVLIEVGEPARATRVPLSAAIVSGSTARLFVVESGRAHLRSVRIIGERDGELFVDPSLAAGSQVVTEGRALLNDGDQVAASGERPAPVARQHAANSEAAR